MNKYKLFFTCAASLLFMSSCYDLDRFPEDQLSAGTFFQTQDHADQAMMGVYSQMTHDDVFGRQFGFDCLGGTRISEEEPIRQQKVLSVISSNNYMKVSHVRTSSCKMLTIAICRTI